MPSWLKGRPGRLMLVLLLALFLGGLGLQAWLNSEIGRGVIETRLSEAMKRPVQLGGELSIALLPVPGAVGGDLRILSTNREALVLAAGEYLVELELWPLLKGEVEVVALRASEAVLDIALLQSETTSDVQARDGLSVIPGIRRFELVNTRVYPAGIDAAPYLQISDLNLDGFQVGQPAAFSSGVRWIMEEGSPVELGLSGRLIIEEQGALTVELLDMDIDYENWVITGIGGLLEVSPSDSTANFQLDWADDEQELEIRTRAGWAPVFAQGQEGFLVEEIVLELDGHSISGKGCFLLGEPSQFHLDLSTPNLELGDFESLGEKWKSPGARTPDTADQPDELPFELAARLVIDRASYEETVAEGIVMTTGPGPDCPERL